MTTDVVLAIKSAPGLMWESWDPAIERLRRDGFTVHDHRSREPIAGPVLAEWASHADGLIVGMEHVGRATLDAAPRLRVIGKPGAGVDNVDLVAATERGVLVCNTAGSNADAVADHTFALMLAVLREIPRLDAMTRAGHGWTPWPPAIGGELWAKTLGVVGTGHIGAAVIRRAAAFSMRVLAYDPYPRQDLVERYGVVYAQFGDVLAAADLVTAHVPLVPETHHLFDAQAFAGMRAGAYFFNLSRGSIADEVALCNALRSGHLAGAGLDVFEDEPPAADSVLFALENVVVTPHVAGFSREAVLASRLQLAETVARALRGEVPATLVNRDVLAVRKMEG